MTVALSAAEAAVSRLADLTRDIVNYTNSASALRSPKRYRQDRQLPRGCVLQGMER